ncbi:hypothetical protein [Oligosphaera ethanolica]|uniref:Uncharacterized protein n=1 Tax=Oligosphaera ethanolica TaxID=760260 RepID=A0AAE3VD06_9BACT|nr:hypothetical protein [Oligosphaera ethanolica]MDQ0288212.1 hypothetical protein [Oligosphaera ethanolica]
MRSLAIYALLGCMYCGVLPLQAQTPTPAATPAAAAANANPDVRFRALEEHEQRGAVLKIRDQLLFERSEKDKRERAIAGLRNALQGTLMNPDDTQKLAGLVTLWQDANSLYDEVKRANYRQLELITLIGNAKLSAGMLPQVASFLLDAEKQTTQLGDNQKKQQEHLLSFGQPIIMAICNVPPPRSFITHSGITMRLCGQGKEWFYVSEQPITEAQYQAVIQPQAGDSAKAPATDSPSPAKTDVSLTNAIRFCGMLTRLEQRNLLLPNISRANRYPPIPKAGNENHTYVLPDNNQLNILSLTSYTPSCAIWINSPWLPNDSDTERALERFAVSFNIVWDPRRLFAESTTFGELPFARYPQLGFVIVTHRNTGWYLRWQHLLDKMDAANAEQPLNTPE